MSTDFSSNLCPSGIIGERYRLINPLASGAVGIVYLAEDLTDGRNVAVKIIFPEASNDPLLHSRFKSEIRFAKTIHHRNVIRLFDIIEEDNLSAISMEYLAGGDLSSVIAEPELPNINDALDMICQACAGLEAVHNARIIHRDIKPENLLLTNNGVVKIADFGVAHSVGATPITAKGTVMGALEYLSPEYVSDDKLNYLCDIYALGMVSYELLTGVLPFHQEEGVNSLIRRINDDPPPPSSFRPDIDESLDELILKAIAREPNKRFQSISEMKNSLERLCKSKLDRKAEGGLASLLSCRNIIRKRF